MSYKPEAIGRDRRILSKGSSSRASKAAKRAATRVARRAAKRDPENAPTRRILKGYMA